MKSRAAVAFASGEPLEIAEVDLEGPKAGEVLVEIKATGICHTDAFTLSGEDPEGEFPVILGHEGAGIVRELGPGVTSVSVDDVVIPLYTPEYVPEIGLFMSCLSLVHVCLSLVHGCLSLVHGCLSTRNNFYKMPRSSQINFDVRKNSTEKSPKSHRNDLKMMPG